MPPAAVFFTGNSEDSRDWEEIQGLEVMSNALDEGLDFKGAP
jgi:hypothetical protein